MQQGQELYSLFKIKATPNLGSARLILGNSKHATLLLSKNPNQLKKKKVQRWLWKV